MNLVKLYLQKEAHQLLVTLSLHLIPQRILIQRMKNMTHLMDLKQIQMKRTHLRHHPRLVNHQCQVVLVRLILILYRQPHLERKRHKVLLTNQKTMRVNRKASITWTSLQNLLSTKTQTHQHSLILLRKTIMLLEKARTSL